jgi:hypothetical protein
MAKSVFGNEEGKKKRASKLLVELLGSGTLYG